MQHATRNTQQSTQYHFGKRSLSGDPGSMKEVDAFINHIDGPTLDKLKMCGISVSRQKAPSVPKGLKLPPGISLSPAPSGYAPGRRDSGSSSGSSSSFSIRPAAEESRPPPPKRVALPPNVAGALAQAGDDGGPKKKVELEISDKQMAALQALGIL